MADKYMQLVPTPAVQQAQDKYFGKHQVLENAPETDPFTPKEAGFIASRDMRSEALQGLIDGVNADRPAGEPASVWKTIPQDAATSVWAGVVAGVRSYALDPERAKALWARSEEMVGERC
jgi:hypothetical protein